MTKTSWTSTILGWVGLEIIRVKANSIWLDLHAGTEYTSSFADQCIIQNIPQKYTTKIYHKNLYSLRRTAAPTSPALAMVIESSVNSFVGNVVISA